MIRGIIGIYVIRNNGNGKVYIGQSVDVEYRICNHFSNLRHNRHDNAHLQRAYNKNPEAFSWELLCKCEQSDLDRLEIEYIAEYKSADPEHGYNKQYGGQAEHRATPETRLRMSITKRGKKFSEEHKRKIGEANRRRTQSAETRRKIGEKVARPVVQMDIDGNFVARHESIKAAAMSVGLKSPNSIRNALSGITVQSAGYRWKYE